ncbi:MAG: LicD family protein, partial [Candidatus Gastranaerophilales bacterium]|nr:LicD family protein [Candidatus Gastranaerophilales bacterium]
AQYSRTEEIVKIRKQLVKDCMNDNNTNEIRAKIKKYMNQIVQTKCNLPESDYIRAIDMAHTGKNYIHSYETFFPLKEISFEGINFPCINDTDTYLTDVYGKSYMGYPPKIGMAHSAYLELEKNHKAALENIVENSGCAR